MKRLHLAALCLLLCCGPVSAAEYGRHDLRSILTVSETASGKTHGLDLQALDRIIEDMAVHARNYPPQFDTDADRQRAAADIGALSRMLGVLTDSPQAQPAILLRAGFLNSMGHNLDVPGAAEKAVLNFEKLLTLDPANARGNLMYGTFLAGAGRGKQALPYLQKALSLGVADAHYPLGLAYLSLRDKRKGLEHLEAYLAQHPGDADANQLVKAIRSGKMEFRQGGG
ncbi:hypothetical protein D0B54_00920 [Solimonas sp. K1W22B-7]|uniref:hypothetical protein n=1 Tax=Solimonas sp. K1W22B-7 TaxID=2303331 RepID=UPI000E33459C|nr:hypothetical protein [Solimonas sp. K1W22B-7]AXQ27336.1 hypothetical protein D0B54_00920 [Solimonas sp. K1W22B-7]